MMYFVYKPRPEGRTVHHEFITKTPYRDEAIAIAKAEKSSVVYDDSFNRREIFRSEVSEQALEARRETSVNNFDFKNWLEYGQPTVRQQAQRGASRGSVKSRVQDAVRQAANQPSVSAVDAAQKELDQAQQDPDATVSDIVDIGTMSDKLKVVDAQRSGRMKKKMKKRMRR